MGNNVKPPVEATSDIPPDRVFGIVDLFQFDANLRRVLFDHGLEHWRGTCCADKVLATDVLRPYCLVPSQAVARRQDCDQRLLDEEPEVQASVRVSRLSRATSISPCIKALASSGEDFVVIVTSTSAASSRRIRNAPDNQITSCPGKKPSPKPAFVRSLRVSCSFARYL